MTTVPARRIQWRFGLPYNTRGDSLAIWNNVSTVGIVNTYRKEMAAWGMHNYGQEETPKSQQGNLLCVLLPSLTSHDLTRPQPLCPSSFGTTATWKYTLLPKPHETSAVLKYTGNTTHSIYYVFLYLSRLISAHLDEILAENRENNSAGGRSSDRHVCFCCYPETGGAARNTSSQK